MPWKQEELTLEGALRALRNSDKNWEAAEFFNPSSWRHNTVRKQDGRLVQKMLQAVLPANNTEDRAWEHIEKMAREGVEDLVKLAWRQQLRTERLPHLGRPTGSKHPKYRSKEWLHQEVLETLERPVKFIGRDHDEEIGGFGYQRSHESLSLPNITAAAKALPVLIDRLKRRGWHTATFERLPEHVSEMVCRASPYYREICLRADLAFNREKAVFNALAFLPEYIGIGGNYVEYGRLGFDDVLEKMADDPSIEGFPLDDARTVVRCILRDGVEFGWNHDKVFAKTEAFYRKLLGNKQFFWAGIAGLSYALDKKSFERVLPDILLPVLPHVASGVPAHMIVSRILAKRHKDTHSRINVLHDDPFDINDLPELSQLYRRARRKVARLLPGTKPHPFEHYLTQKGSMSHDMSMIQYAAETFTLPPEGRRRMIIQGIAASAREKLFRPYISYGETSPFSRLEMYADAIEGMLDLAPEQERYIIETAGSFITEEAESSLRLLKHLQNPKSFRKLHHDKRKRDALHKILTQKEKLALRLDELILKHDSALAVFDGFSEWTLFKNLERELPDANVFFATFAVTQNDSYRTLRQIATRPGQWRFITGLLSHFGFEGERMDMNWRSREEIEAPPIDQALEGAYRRYALLENRLHKDPARTKAHAHERSTLRALKQQIRELKERPGSEQLVAARERERLAITGRQMNTTLRQLWEYAVPVALEKIVGRPVPTPSADVTHAAEVYFSSERYPALQERLKTLLREHLDKQPYSHLNEPANVAFLDRLRQQGAQTAPWTDGFEESYETGDDADRARHLRWRHEHEARELLNNLRITTDDLEDGYRQAVAMTQDRDVLADLRTQLDALKASDEAHGRTTARIYIERDPLRILQMGDLIDFSCLRVGGGNSFSTIANAIDENKRVLYAESDGRIIGRKLIAITEEGKIVQYRTYTKGTYDLDEPFERFIGALAEKMRLPLADRGEVAKLVASEWYDDHPQPFRSLKKVPADESALI